MERMAMDQSLKRGAVAALIALEAFVPRAHAQAVGAVQSRPTRDSVIVRVFDATERAKIDSIMLKFRSLSDEPVSSEQSLRIRQEMEMMFRQLSALRGAGTGTFLFRGGPEIRQMPRLKGWIGLTAGLALREEMAD